MVIHKIQGIKMVNVIYDNKIVEPIYVNWLDIEIIHYIKIIGVVYKNLISVLKEMHKIN